MSTPTSVTTISTLSMPGIALAVLLALLLGAGGGTWWGKRLEQKNQASTTVTQLQAALQGHADLVRRSSEASQAIRQATARLRATQGKTYKEITDELQATAPDRAGCVFPAGVMRGISAARDRAEDAATRGLVNTVPTPATSAADDR